MQKIPLDQKLVNHRDIALSINELIDAVFWISPTINPDCGTIEPTEQFLRDGLLAYADGTNWDPGGGKGIYYYDIDTPEWVKVG